MVKGFRDLWLLVLAIFFLFLNSELLAATETLESPTLRLELNTAPYSYRVIERSSGKVLLSQSSIGVTFGPELYPVSDATDVSKTSNRLRAELLLQLAGREGMPSGTPAKAQVSFTFLKHEVLQVSITYKGASPSEISEEFNDQGEHYYGIWEHPFGGSVDNRGADRDFLGIGRGGEEGQRESEAGQKLDGFERDHCSLQVQSSFGPFAEQVGMRAPHRRLRAVGVNGHQAEQRIQIEVA